jgi:hypothetical protein
MFSMTRAVWNTAKEVSFHAISRKMFLVQSFCLGDWKRVMEEGPWIFKGYVLMT